MLASIEFVNLQYDSYVNSTITKFNVNQLNLID